MPKPRAVITIAEPPRPVGRPKVKLCQWLDGCGHTVARDARFCPKHCAYTLTALRASREYRTDDQRGLPRGHISPAYERTKVSEL